MAWAAGGAALLAGACAWLAWRWKRHGERVEGAFESASLQLEQLQLAFQKFAPQDVIEDVIARGMSTRGERREVTVLFADLVGYTALVERLEPEQVVRMLNGYFHAMSKAITAHRGHVSKFMGDGLLALFGAPEPNPWQALDAVRAALAMREALKGYNASLEAEGLTPLAVGIGIHRGGVVAGVFGSGDLMEYTVLGDVVNTASRVEGLTRRVGADVLITEAIKEKLDGRCRVRALPPADIRGKAEKVTVYAVEAWTE